MKPSTIPKVIMQNGLPFFAGIWALTNGDPQEIRSTNVNARTTQFVNDMLNELEIGETGEAENLSEERITGVAETVWDAYWTDANRELAEKAWDRLLGNKLDTNRLTALIDDPKLVTEHFVGNDDKQLAEMAGAISRQLGATETIPPVPERQAQIVVTVLDEPDDKRLEEILVANARNELENPLKSGGIETEVETVVGLIPSLNPVVETAAEDDGTAVVKKETLSPVARKAKAKSAAERVVTSSDYGIPDSLTVAELKTVCKGLGIPISGTKPQLLNQARSAQAELNQLADKLLADAPINGGSTGSRLFNWSFYGRFVMLREGKNDIGTIVETLVKEGYIRTERDLIDTMFCYLESIEVDFEEIYKAAKNAEKLRTDALKWVMLRTEISEDTD